MSNISNAVLHEKIDNIKAGIDEINRHLKELNGKVAKNAEFRILHNQETKQYNAKLDKNIELIKGHQELINKGKGAFWILTAVFAPSSIYSMVELFHYLQSRL